jgi:predicted RNA-binding protein with RPS1 domain
LNASLILLTILEISCSRCRREYAVFFHITCQGGKFNEEIKKPIKVNRQFVVKVISTGRKGSKSDRSIANAEKGTNKKSCSQKDQAEETDNGSGYRFQCHKKNQKGSYRFKVEGKDRLDSQTAKQCALQAHQTG